MSSALTQNRAVAAANSITASECASPESRSVVLIFAVEFGLGKWKPFFRRSHRPVARSEAPLLGGSLLRVRVLPCLPSFIPKSWAQDNLLRHLL